MNPIISKLLAHKAALMMTAAMGGVVVTSILAVKDSKKHEKEVRKCCAEFPDEDIKEETETVDEFYKVNVPKKDKAIIFAKSYWRTGLSMAVTFGLMVLSHHSMVKEIAGLSAALGIMSTKYKELDATLKKKYPDAHKKIHKFIDEKNSRKEISEKPFIKEESYDGRQRYWEPWSNQIFFATDTEIKTAECVVNEKVANTGAATLYDYISAFPKKCELKLEDWMKRFGWFTGAAEETSYEYNIGYFGPYLKPEINKTIITVEGEQIVVNNIEWIHSPDIEPDIPASIGMNVEEGLKLAKKKFQRRKKAS